MIRHLRTGGVLVLAFLALQGCGPVAESRPVALLESIQGAAFIDSSWLDSSSPGNLGHTSRRDLGAWILRTQRGKREGGVVQRSHDRLSFERPGTLLMVTDVPDGAISLDLEATLSGAPGAPRARIEIEAAAIDGARLVERSVSLATAGESPRVDLSISIPPDAPRPLIWRLRVDGASRRARVVVKNAAFRWALPTSGSSDRPKQTFRPDPSDGRPDVLLIILDAARGDRFGYAGYPRNTTPHIDTVARRSVRYLNAFAECPSTPCSIPGLLSGSMWSRPLNVRKGRNEVAARTLAEYLQDAGYRTIGITANPNNSVGQGFDRLLKTWEDPRSAGDGSPTSYPSVRREIEAALHEIHSNATPRPLLLQVHLLPPHEPYFPAPRFDVFGDPDYQGPVTPGMPLEPIRRSGRALKERDLRELESHYDGGLRMVDDLLGDVFDAWRESGRWDRSILVLTSDHGEAFYEHGFLGHNNSIYDEMLRVPLLIHLPGQREGRSVDAPVSLLALLPTVLATIGLHPEPGTPAVNLLDPGQLERPRVMLHRALLENPVYAVRYGRWKGLFRRGRPSELFDLEVDPHEQANVAAERPLQIAAMALLLVEANESAGGGEW